MKVFPSSQRLTSTVVLMVSAEWRETLISVCLLSASFSFDREQHQPRSEGDTISLQGFGAKV